MCKANCTLLLQPGKRSIEMETQIKESKITEWKLEKPLMKKITSVASLTTKNYIYILGGYSENGYTDTIQRASFDANGDLTSTWSNVGTLPQAMSNMGYVATKGRFYLIGGRSGYDNFSSVYSAPINADGTLGSFREETPLPDERYNSVCFVIKDKLYVVGGFNIIDGSDIYQSNSVYQATIKDDGTLSNWKILPNFPIKLSHGTPLLIKDRVYIIQAYNDSTHGSKICYITYDSNGDIDKWIYISDMPDNIHNSAIAYTDDYVFSIGGYDISNGRYMNTVYRAPILDNGYLGEWIKINDVPKAIIDAQAVIINNKIYLIGGWDDGGILDTVYSATFTSGITDYTPFYAD
jgi:N-acetylneuraminic acid mutarotase